MLLAQHATPIAQTVELVLQKHGVTGSGSYCCIKKRSGLLLLPLTIMISLTGLLRVGDVQQGCQGYDIDT